MAKIFSIGEVVADREVWELIDENDDFSQFVTICLSRYVANDWGEISKEEKKKNDEAVLNDGKLFASYRIPRDFDEVDHEYLWIITEEDRSTTTILFPED